MAVTIAAADLNRLVQTARHIRDEGDARLDITSETLRIRALANDRSVYLDYELPRVRRSASASACTTSLWVDTNTLSAVLRACETACVTIKLPNETIDSTVVVRAGDLTYRFFPVTAAHPLLFTDDSAPESRATTTVSQRALTRSITAANFVGDELRLNVDPSRNRVEFRATGELGGDGVRYELPASRVHACSGREATFTMQISRLRHLRPYFPSERSATLSIRHGYLVLEATPPNEGTLTLYIAFRSDPLQYQA